MHQQVLSFAGLAAVIALGPFESTETAAAISKAIPRSTAMTVLFAKYLGRAEVWRIAAAAVIALEVIFIERFSHCQCDHLFLTVMHECGSRRMYGTLFMETLLCVVQGPL